MGISAPTFPLASGLKTIHVIVQTNQNANLPLIPIAGDSNATSAALESFFRKADVGAWKTNTYVAVNGAYASDLVTFSSIANNDTVTVNGRIYTAKTSGASGAQQFNIGGSDTAAAANFAAAVNADTNTAIKSVVAAVATGATITLFCWVPGNIGLQMTASISAHGTVASANFTGGSEGTNGDQSHGL
jgi:hypothetical protein